MKELIRKILRESEDLERIQRNEVSVPKVVPSIVRFIKEEYGNRVSVETHNKGVFFGSDDYRGVCKEIRVYVQDERLVAADVKVKLWNDIKNFFGIDMSRYGACLSLEVYRKKWEKV